MQSTHMENYQVAVVGGGPGGYVAAIRCAQHGLKTVLIEADALGGTCLNRGCIPTKALLHGAQQYAQALEALKSGVLRGEVSCDFAAIAAHKDRVVKQLRGGVAALESASGVTILNGRAALTDAHTLRVGETEISAQKIILATGSLPAKPPIPGIDGARVLTSDETLHLTQLPASLVIIGGGVIGMEFAALFSALGTKVTVLEMMEDILPGVERALTQPLKKRLSSKGVSIVTSARVTAVHSGESDVSVNYAENGAEHTASGAYCIACTGRKPATADLGLEACGISLRRGFIEVDEHMLTGIPHIYAVGDISGKSQLAHVASAQGLVAADHCAGQNRRMRYDCVPACIYTTPEIAFVGMTAAQARDKGFSVKTGSFPLAGNGKALIMEATDGLAELVTDARTGQILGAQIFAPRATDMIAEIAALMRAEGTVDELADTIHPHPTLSESIFEAALDALDVSCHKMPMKKERSIV